jgi:4-hydroxybenzoate polyprenyltransferase
VSGASGLLGLALAGDIAPRAFWRALAVFFVVYGLGQAATDVSQTDTDALSSPYRPLVRRIVRKRDVLVVALVGLVGCAAVLASTNPWTLPVGATAVAGLLTYTRLKRRFWAGPLHNAWIVALLPVLGALCGGASVGKVLSAPSVLLAAASTFGSYAVFVLLGYLKDVEADRVTGYETIPVRFGRRTAVAVSACLGALALVPSAILAAPAAARPPTWSIVATPFWLAGVVYLVVAHVGMLGVRRDDDAHPWIVASVRSFVLLRLGEALAHDPSLFHGAIAIIILLEASLGARPDRRQV